MNPFRVRDYGVDVHGCAQLSGAPRASESLDQDSFQGKKFLAEPLVNQLTLEDLQPFVSILLDAFRPGANLKVFSTSYALKEQIL